jgi:hypothetical protein
MKTCFSLLLLVCLSAAVTDVSRAFAEDDLPRR